MLQDVDLKYSAGSLKTTKNVSVGGTLNTTGATTLASTLAVTGATTLSSTLAVSGAITMGGSSVTSGAWLPSDHGLIAWSGDPSNATTTSSAVNGTVYLVRMNIRTTGTVSTIWWCQTTGPVSPVAGQSFVGLYSSAGTLLSSAGTDAKTGNGIQSIALDAAQSVTAGTFVWVGLMFNAATPPVMMRHGGQNAAANTMNLTASTARWAVNGTGATALPSPITPASNSQTGVLALWAAIS